MAKLKEGYFSNASLVFQLWLKDIQMNVLECHLTKLEAIQVVQDYTLQQVWLKVEYYLGFTPKGEQSFQRLKDHLSLAFLSSEMVSPW